MTVTPRSGVRVLLVAQPRERKLYEYLARRLAEVESVEVIMERRNGDRRRTRQGVAVERRNGDRRQRRVEVSALGYSVVRLRPGTL